jgi:hypothetical protein
MTANLEDLSNLVLRMEYAICFGSGAHCEAWGIIESGGLTNRAVQFSLVANEFAATIAKSACADWVLSR